MEKKWTEAQLAAINADKEKILVSAAAGSGKTATLIERIIRSITDKTPPMTISRMLVVTFTHAAASELKSRVMAALTSAVANNPDNMHLSNQLLLLESADISTIDAFCLDIVRNEFHRINFDADFRIGDPADLALLAEKAMDEAIEEVFRNNSGINDSAIHEFLTVLHCSRDDRDLAKNLIAIYGELQNIPEGNEFIKNHIDELRSDSLAGDINSRAKHVIVEETRTLFEHIKTVLTGFCEYSNADEEMDRKYGPAISSDLNFADMILELCHSEDYFSIRENLTNLQYRPIGRLSEKNATPHTQAFKKEREKYKEKISALTKDYYSYDKDDVLFINRKSEDFLTVLYSVFSEYEKIYGEKKKIGKCVEFNDLKRETYRLFVDSKGNPTPLAREYSSKYDIIYIDEYQDVDPIQDKIFYALSSECTQFMVGDIKQSIYGFRGSDSSIFGNMRSRFTPYDKRDENRSGYASIAMSNNFRCSKPIINAANHITGHLFRNTDNTFGKIGYTKDDELVFSKQESDIPSPKVEFVAVKRDKDLDANNDHSPFAPEIRYIAKQIRFMIENCKKEDGKNFEYGDFAVLTEGNKQVNFVSDLLNSLGIPADEAVTKNFFESPEVMLISSLLYAIDNPLRDIPTTAILLSPLFSFTDSELFEIKKIGNKTSVFESLEEYAVSKIGKLSLKCSNALERLNSYSRLAHSKSVDEFIPILWSKIDIDAVSTFFSDDGKTQEMRLTNIKKLYNKAIEYSSGSYKTLHDFLVYIDDLIESGNYSESNKFKMQNGNRVHVLTIHKSKGLEFPVVFLFATCDTGKTKPKETDIVFEPEIGFTFNPSAENGLIKINSPYKKAAETRKKNKEKLEKIRLLYVALTRAREKLYITATYNSDYERIKKKYADYRHSLFSYIDTKTAYSVLNAKNFAEWVIQSDILACDDIALSEYDDVVDASFAKPLTSETGLGISRGKLTSEEIKRLGFSYYSDESTIPAKMTVSSLSPSILDENPVYNMEKTERSDSFLESPIFLTGGKITGAEKGTATHLFLQFCDFDYVERNGVNAEIRRLTEKGFVLPQHGELINIRSLERFFKSEFYLSMKKSKTVYREQRFNIPLPAHIFTEIPEKREAFLDNYLLVQGVIDIIIEKDDGSIILADYKTDYIPEEIYGNDEEIRKMFSDRYSKQLGYYALAIRRIFGRYPDRIIIYSLSTAKEYSVDFDESRFD